MVFQRTANESKKLTTTQSAEDKSVHASMEKTQYMLTNGHSPALPVVNTLCPINVVALCRAWLMVTNQTVE